MTTLSKNSAFLRTLVMIDFAAVVVLEHTLFDFEVENQVIKQLAKLKRI